MLLHVTCSGQRILGKGIRAGAVAHTCKPSTGSCIEEDWEFKAISATVSSSELVACTACDPFSNKHENT